MVIESIKGELLKFKSTDGFELQGMLCLPSKKTRKVLIHLHGMTGFFWSHAGFQLKKAAFNNKIAFFPFNNRGLGGLNFLYKFSKRKIEYVPVGTSFEKFEDCIKDIEGTINFLRKKGFNQFILSGHSTGCQKVAYYQSIKNDKKIKGLVLLAPADDINFEKHRLKGRFNQCLNIAKKLVKDGKGDSIMPKKCAYILFNAKRYYDLYKNNSLEGNIFNYNKKLNVISKIKCPILSAFGNDDHYAVISAKKMLEKIQHFSKNKLSETFLTKGDHSFRGGEKELIKAASLWIRNII